MISVGRRKEAVARVTIEKGSGNVIVNNRSLEDYFRNKYIILYVREPLILASEKASKLNYYVNVKGGGILAQAEATRQAIAKGLVEYYRDEELKKLYEDYDVNLLVADSRRNEPHHSSGRGASKRGSRRHKQRSKR